MRCRRYNKQPLSIDEQIKRLQDRGMRIDDAARAKRYLTNIGYYRLSAYWLPFEPPCPPGESRLHQFQPGTTFDQVLSLYIFDRQLRLLVMEAIERIEISVRTHWAHALAMRHGSHAHLQASLFNSPWDHASDIARMARELKGSRETFIKHYLDHYDDPFLPPIWAVVETLSFGSLSRWFQASKDNSAKSAVSQDLGMPKVDIAEKVLHALTPVRNICAHHGRLWNRQLTLSLPIIKRLGQQMVTELITKEDGSQQKQAAKQIYNYLLVMAHMMRHINPKSSWRHRLKEHIQAGPRHYHEDHRPHQKVMGFPEDWENMETWR